MGRTGRFIAITVLLCLALAPGASAICRVVEPSTESGGVVFDLTTMALYVFAPHQVVGRACRQVDSDPPFDADLADESLADEDAGLGEEDAGAEEIVADEIVADEITVDGSDTETCPSGSQLQDVHGSVVHMVVQPQVLAWGGTAGLVMPVPSRPEVHVANRRLFESLGALLVPQVETETTYVEDPSLGFQCKDPKFSTDDGCDSSWSKQTSTPGTRGRDTTDFFEGDDDQLQKLVIGDGVVSFRDGLVTPEYRATVLSASTPEALFSWMDDNGFEHDANDDAAFAHYVRDGGWFVALQVHPPDDGGVRVDLEPVVVSWRARRIPLVHRLQYDPRGGRQITEAFVLAPQRMKPADDSAETLYAARAHFGGDVAGFGLATGWITQLRFDRDVGVQMPDSELVEGHQSEDRPVLLVEETVRIPSSKCPSDGEAELDDGCACAVHEARIGSRALNQLGPMTLALAMLWWRGRRRNR